MTVAQGFTHFFTWLENAHHPRRFGQERFDRGESFAETAVEFFCNVVGEFEVLELILADRDYCRVIDEDVSRLQDWIREQSGIRGMSASNKVFVLGHSLQLSDGGQATENPRKFRMFQYLRLHEYRALRGVEPQCQKVNRQIQNFRGFLFRVEFFRKRMEVNDREIAIVLVLEVDKILNSAEIIP